MLKLTTKSGTIYYLDGKKLKRVSEKPLKYINTGGPMDHDPDWEEVSFTQPPVVGASFGYYHPTLYGCWSTPIVSIEEVDKVE